MKNIYLCLALMFCVVSANAQDVPKVTIGANGITLNIPYFELETPDGTSNSRRPGNRLKS